MINYMLSIEVQFFSKLGISVGAINEHIVEFSTPEFNRSNIMYVTSLSPYNTITSHKTMKFIQNYFKNRGNSDKKVWLIGLDTSGDREADWRYLMMSYLNNTILLLGNEIFHISG